MTDKLRELIKKLDRIEEEQQLNEKRIKAVRMELVHMLSPYPPETRERLKP